MSDEVNLPSGAVLKVNVAPFADAKALYQAVLEELKGVHFDSSTDLTALFKDIAFAGFASKKIELCLDQCFKRCLYNELKIDKATFEPVDARQDYVVVCIAVAKANIAPFLNGLLVEFKQFTQKTASSKSQS